MRSVVLFLILIQSLNACLIIRQNCDCFSKALGRYNIDLYLTNTSYYQYSSLALPHVTKVGCETRFYCDEQFELLIVNGTSVFTIDAGSGATGKCSSGKWSVTDDRQNKHTLDKFLAFCYYTKPTRFCLPSEPKLFLFAYSRDFSWSDLDTIVFRFSRSPNVAPEFKTFAHVQIDAVEQQEIHFSENYTAFYESIRPQILNPAPGFGDSKTGSDLTKFLATYLKTQPRIACGARIFAVLKRYPNQEDVSELVSLLQQYRITLEITVSADTVGGDGVDVVYQLTGQTYGIRRQAIGDAYMYYYMSQFRHNQVSSYYPVFISNVYVSGNGSITLPDLEIPFDGTYMVSYGYVEKAKDIWNATHMDSDWEWINVESSEVLHAPPWTFWRVGVFASELNMTRGLYHSKFNYQFRKNDEMRIQLRVHSLTLVNYWIPFPKWLEN